MHGPSRIILILVALLLGRLDVASGADLASPAQQVSDARRALTERHPAVAINLLERVLGDKQPLSTADKGVVLGLLGQAYETAADQADTAGRPLDAESLRENARILRRKASPATSATAQAPTPAAPVPAARPEPPAPAVAIPAIDEQPVDAPQALPEMSLTTETPRISPESRASINSVRPGLASMVTPEPAPTPEPAEAPAEPAGPGVVEADAAFRSKRWAEAGRIYAGLAQTNQLPDDRRDHWAYCRAAEVARKIAAKPKTEAEWASIDAEIEQIRRLAPNSEHAAYLRNRASTRPTAARKPSKAGETIVRAASPEEPAPAPKVAPTPKPRRGTTTEVADAPVAAQSPAPQGQPGAPIGRWRIRESANFRIVHADPNLAEQVVQVAESVRRDQFKRWSGKLPSAPWQPRCEIYLYPSAQQYAQMTGQPADSPGFSTMGMNEGQIISRRVNLRTDHDGLLVAILPHEVTHVILADFFPDQQIPRWADEGMAVLTEPVAEQKRRAADLVEPLNRNLLFPIETLMKMDYPDNRYWSLYYAQSVSLTKYLVDQGTPDQLVDFLQGAQTKGFEVELKRVYKIDGFKDLEARWFGYARANLDGNPPTATAANTPRAENRTR